jgi:hypothetical protein
MRATPRRCGEAHGPQGLHHSATTTHGAEIGRQFELTIHAFDNLDEARSIPSSRSRDQVRSPTLDFESGLPRCFGARGILRGLSSPAPYASCAVSRSMLQLRALRKPRGGKAL